MSSPRFLSGPTREHLQALLNSACDGAGGDTQAWRLLSLQRAITTTLAERPGRVGQGVEISDPDEEPMARILERASS